MIDKDCAQAADLLEAVAKANPTPEVAAEVRGHAERLHDRCAEREAARIIASNMEGRRGTLADCDCQHLIGGNHGQPRA